MKYLTNITIVLLLLISTISFGQVTIERQVIGSTGGYSVGSSISLSSTVGEAVIQSLFSTSTILTQGFQQPQTNNNSVVDYEVINESCDGAKNGSIFINKVLGCAAPYSVLVVDTLSNDTLGQDTLGFGGYMVYITGATGCKYNTTITVELDSDEPCVLKFYSGITPNGDGVNDIWVIDNIELFPENTVQIFNRWGGEVWFGEGYNNNDIAWYGNLKGGDTKLADATYFYIVNANNKTYKGWVEISR